MAVRFTAADDEQLIELAAGHAMLWDMSSEEFKNTIKKELVWKEIGAMLNKTGQQCKTRWRNIRDHYRKVKKQNMKTTGSAATKKRAAYWDRLQFLDKVEDERQSISNADETQEGVDEETFSENGDTPLESSPCAESTSDNISNKKKRDFESDDRSSYKHPNYSVNKRGRQHTELVGILQKRSEERASFHRSVEKTLQHDTDDEIDLFFRSIAATVKKFDPEAKNGIKSHIFSVFTEYELQHIRRSHATGTSSTSVSNDNLTRSTPPSFIPVPSYDSGSNNDAGHIQDSNTTNDQESGNYFQLIGSTCNTNLHYYN